MQITHSIKFTDDEVQSLFELARYIGEVQFSTALNDKEKVEIITKSTQQFNELLTSYGQEAFEHGFHMGIKKSKEL